MDSHLSPTAHSIAAFWADGHNRPDVVIRGFARQVQDHIDHHGDPDYLRRVAAWMSLQHPTVLDLDLALHLRGAPRPEVVARSSHACACRGGPVRGRAGAPAPALIRQLIRSPYTRAA